MPGAPLAIGRFRLLIDIQNVPITQGDAGGTEKGDPVTIASVFAAFVPIGGKEAIEAGKFTGTVTGHFRIRWRPGILRTYQIRWVDNGTSPATERFYNIDRIQNFAEGRRELQIFVTEKPDGDAI